MREPFVNEPFTDFSRPENRQAQEAALQQVGERLGRAWPLVIGGERIETDQVIDSRNPTRPSQVVGRVARAGVEEAERAIRAANDAFEGWSHTDPAARARIFWRAAQIMRRRRFELNAWLVYEISKTWPEADADVAEAIDFLEFYGRQMVRLASPQELTPIPGEEGHLMYLPLGPGAVIPPWNFACAIMAGMSSSAAIAGNTVVLKPAPDASVIAAVFCEILEEAGLPPGVINYCPGMGADVGDHLTGSRDLAFVSFTGSKQTGLRIYERVARPHERQRWIKRAMLEMGGKDAIVVADDADLDAAARGIVASAYGFQGQKCSACSRAIVHEAVHDALLEKVRAGAEALKVGDPVDPATQMGAVINEAQLDKVMRYIEVGKQEGELVTGGRRMEELGEGYFVQPTIYSGIERGARMATEEIFGPVLAFERAPSFEAAIDSANATEYGLTGGVYARSRRYLEHARRHFQVGNLYFNRKCTGALVGAQPFGGFKMSGTDAKAGGRDYLLHLLNAKVVTEAL